MPELNDNVKRMMQSGVPEDEIASYIKKYQSGPAVSTITGKPTPTYDEELQSRKNLAAGAVRYGVPAVAGIVAPQLSIPMLAAQALISGGSELAARRLERTGSDPELDTMWSDLQAGGITGALDFTVNAATRGIGSAFRRVAGKLLIPSEMPLEVRIAQETLGDLPNEYMKKPGPVKRFLDFVGIGKGKRPFSLTYGQLNGEEKRFITWMEGIARAGIGSRGRMDAFDVRNERAVTGLIERYVSERSTQLTGPEFATFAQRIVGDIKNRGEMFEPVVAYRKFLYTKFEDALSQSGGTIDGSALRSYIRESAGIEDNFPKRIFARLRSEGLVPPLEPAATSKRTVTNTRTQKVASENIDETRDLTRTDLTTGEESRINDATIGTRARSNEGTAQTIRETETIGGMTEDELAAEWASLPAGDVDKIIKAINAHWKDGNDEANNVLNYMRDKIENPFLKFVRSNADLAKYHDAADTFFKQEVATMRNAAIKGLRKSLTDNPSKALSMLGGGSNATSARQTYDRLMAVKKALQFSEQSGGTAIQEWEDTFLRPIRYDMLTRNVDRFSRLNPNGFLDMLNKNADVPEFFNEVFGGAAQVDQVKRLMTTLSVLQQPPKEKSIFIQLAQAGAIGGAFGTAAEALFSDDISIKGATVGAGTAILIGPYALSRMLTNPNAIRSFTDGIEAGARSGRFAIGLRKIAEMKYASTLLRESPSQDAVNFYSSMPQQQQPTQ